MVKPCLFGFDNRLGFLQKCLNTWRSNVIGVDDWCRCRFWCWLRRRFRCRSWRRFDLSWRWLSRFCRRRGCYNCSGCHTLYWPVLIVTSNTDIKSVQFHFWEYRRLIWFIIPRSPQLVQFHAYLIALGHCYHKNKRDSTDRVLISKGLLKHFDNLSLE